VLLNSGRGRFGPAHSYAAGADPVAVAIGDVTGDGKPDLIVANGESDVITILPGNGDGTFGAAETLAAGPAPHFVALADLTGNGRLDIIVGDGGSGIPGIAGTAEIAVLMNLGGGQFAPPVLYGAGMLDPFGMVVADFTGNGRYDIAVSNPAFHQVDVFAGNGDGTFRYDASYVTAFAPIGIAAGPFFGPGGNDLAVPGAKVVDLVKANRSPSETA
jgi:FG-GAP-like repeat